MKPLAGIRILDLSRLLPGPYASMLLADLGAEVIKIEPPLIGDYMRSMPPFISHPETGEAISAPYVMVNRNKQSVALNFRDERGKDIFYRLARDADVVLESFRPGAAARWGLGYDALHAVNPRLVYCSLSGYGQTGPYASRAGHDINYIALTGMLAANGRAGEGPTPPAAQVADLSGAMLAVISILAAIIERAKTGEGKYLDVSLFDGALSWTGTVIGGSFAAGKKIERGKLQLNGGMACYNVYETQDGEFITLGAIERQFWLAFCNAVGRLDLSDKSFEFEPIAEVAAIFKTKTRDEWLAFFRGVDACIEPVRDFSEVFDDPHVRHRGLIAEFDVTGVGKIRQVGSVFVFAPNHASPPPRLGEHTRETLRRLDFSDSELDELEKAGVIQSTG